MAAAGYAPALLGFEQLVLGWLLIVQEYVDALPVLPGFFTLLLLLLDQSCWLPAVAADVDRLLRLMSRRPASFQTEGFSAVLVTLKPAAAYLCSSC